MKSPLTQLILATLLCGAALVGYGIWYSLIQAKSAHVGALEQQIESNADAVTRVAAARASLAEISSDEASIQSYFISDNDVATFSDALEANYHAPGATVKVLSVSKNGSGSTATLTFMVSVDGTFDTVMRTIGIIEYAPYAASLSNISVALGDKSKGGWHADVTLIVSSVPTTASTTPAAASTTPSTP